MGNHKVFSDIKEKFGLAQCMTEALMWIHNNQVFMNWYNEDSADHIRRMQQAIYLEWLGFLTIDKREKKFVFSLKGMEVIAFYNESLSSHSHYQQDTIG